MPPSDDPSSDPNPAASDSTPVDNLQPAGADEAETTQGQSAQALAQFNLPQSETDLIAPKPEAPPVSWDQLSKSDQYKQATPEQQQTVLANYASDTRNYLLSLPGSNASQVDEGLHGFLQSQEDAMQPKPDTGIIHQLRDFGRRVNATVLQNVVEKPIAAIAEQSAEFAKNPGIIGRISDAISPNMPLGSNNRAASAQFFTDAADVWSKAAEKAPAAFSVDPLLDKHAVAKAGEFAGGLLPLLAGGPEVLFSTAALDSYHTAYTEAPDGQKDAAGNRALNISLASNAVFMAQGEAVAKGLGSALAKDPSIKSSLFKFLVKATGASVGNVITGQATKAVEAGFAAPDGQKLAAAGKAFDELSPAEAAQQVAFGLLAGHPLEVFKQTAKDYSASKQRADDMTTAGLPNAAAAEVQQATIIQKNGELAAQQAFRDAVEKVEKIAGNPPAEEVASTPAVPEPVSPNGEKNGSAVASAEPTPAQAAEANGEPVSAPEAPAEAGANGSNGSAPEPITDATVMRGDQAHGDQIAKELGLDFKGVQQNVPGHPSLLIFQDPEAKGTAVTGYAGETIADLKSHIEETREKFNKPAAPAEPVVPNEPAVETAVENKSAVAPKKSALTELPFFNRYEAEKEFKSKNADRISAVQNNQPNALAALNTDYHNHVAAEESKVNAQRDAIGKQNTEKFLNDPKKVLADLKDETSNQRTFDLGEIAQHRGIAEVVKVTRQGKGTLVGKGTIGEHTASPVEISVKIGDKIYRTEHSFSLKDRYFRARAESMAVRESLEKAAAESSTPEAAVENKPEVVKPAVENKSAVVVPKKESAAPPNVKKNGAPARLPTNPTTSEKVVNPVDLANTEKRDLGKRIKVPKGATSVRVTDAKGRKSIVPLRELTGSNPFHEAGPFKKIEAGTIAKGNVFNPLKEEISLKSAADDEDFRASEIERGTESDRLPSEQLKGQEPGSIESEEVGSPVAGSDEGEKSTDSAGTHGASPSSRWLNATHEGVADALRAKGVEPESAGWTHDAAAKVTNVINKVYDSFAGAREDYRDRARNKIQSDLLENVKQTGNPLRTLSAGKLDPTKAGQEVPYNYAAVARREIGNAQEKIGLRETKSLDAPSLTRGEGTLADVISNENAKELDQTAGKVEKSADVEGEHPQAKIVRDAIARHFAAFAKWVGVPKDAAPEATSAQTLRAAHIVYDDILQKSTGHALDIGEKFDLRSRPGAVNKLVADPAFRAAVENRVAGRIRQDIRAGVPKDRAPLKADATVGDVKSAWYHASHNPIEELAPREVKNVDSLGTWVSGNKELAKTLYGKKVHSVNVEGAPKFLEFDGADKSQIDFHRVLGGNAKLAEEVGLTKEAKILSKTLPNTERVNELHKKFEVEGKYLTPSEHTEYSALRKAEVASRTLLRSPEYNRAFRKMLEDQGYDGIRWKNSRIDTRPSDPSHDVAVIFNKTPLRAESLKSEEIKLGFQRELDKPALEKASEQIKGGVPFAQVLQSLPEHIREQTRDVSDRFHLREGSVGAMKAIAESAPRNTDEGRMQSALAEAYSKLGENHNVVADPTLAIRRGAAAEYYQKSGTIRVDSGLNDDHIREALLHEKGHGILASKTDAYLRGDLHLLSKDDVSSFHGLESAMQEALAHPDVPDSIRQAATEKTTAGFQKAFADAKARGENVKPFVGLTSLHEFVQYALTNRDFQQFLNGIKSSTPEGRPTTLLSKVLDTFKLLAVGLKGMIRGSVLERALEHSFNLTESGTLEDQLALKYSPEPESEPTLKSQADDFRQDQEKQSSYLDHFATDHGYKSATEMAIEDPNLFNASAEGYRKQGVASTTEAPIDEPTLRSVADDPKVQDDTEKRAEGMFKLIDAKKWSETPAAEIVRSAMENGASTPEDFAQAFEKAGLKPEAAQAVGDLTDSHFKLAGLEKAQEVKTEADKASTEREEKDATPVTPNETEDGKPTVTSIKNAQVDEERAARGLPSAIRSAKKEFGETWDNAQARIEKNPDWPQEIINKSKNNPHPLSDEENAALLHRQITLQNDYSAAAEAMVTANEHADFGAYEENRVKLAKLSDDLLDVYNVGKRAGTENARGLVTRKMLAREDYSLANMETTKRAALGGRELTNDGPDSEMSKLKDLHKKIFDLQQKLVDRADRVDAKNSDQAGEDAVKNIGDKVKESPTGARNLDAERQSIVAGARKQFAKSGDPADLQRYAQKLAENYIRRGIDKLQTVSRAVHETLKSIMPEITERQTRDLISGYGDYKQLDKDAVKVQVRDLKGKLQQAAKLDDMLAEGKAPSKTGVERRNPGDHERRLTKLVNEAKKTGDFNVTDKATQLKTVLDGIKTRLKNQIKDLAFRIETGAKKATKDGVAYDQEADTLRALRDRVQATLTDIEGKPGLSDEQRIDIAKRSLEKQIADYDERLKTDDFSKKQGTTTPNTPELEALRARRDAVRAEYKEMEAIAHPERALDRALAGFRTRTANRLADYQEKLANGDFAPRTARKPLTLTDPADLRLKADVERAKQEFDLGKRKDMLENRSPGEKVGDALAKWGRAAKLTAITTLGKLTAAAAHRVATTPIEEAIGGVLGHLPVLRDVAKLAPSEGGFNIKAEAKAITEGFTTGMRDGYDTLVKGQSDLSAAFGKRLELPNSVLDFFGTIHGAMKAPVKRAAFARSLEKRMASAIAAGVDVSDPLVQTNITLEAYKDSNRAIFLQDNRVVSAYKQAVAALERPNKAGEVSGLGKTGATIAKVLVPIVKVPTNYVAEAFTHAFGAVSGSYKLARAMSKGIENLKPDEADAIMRHLKKGSLGAAVMLWGFFNPTPGVIQAGGYYQPGEKRKAGDIEAGGLRVFGHDVPRVLAHTPLLEALQIGATARRVMDHQIKKGGSAIGSLGSAALAGGLGLAQETPFLDAMFNLQKLKDAPGNYFGDLAKGVIVPGAVNNLASFLDRKNGQPVKRKPKNFLQRIETGIPGLRQRVPQSRD